MLKLMRFLKPYRLPIAIVFVLVFLSSLANLYLPTLMADIVDVGIRNGDTGYIIRIGGLMLGVTVLGTIFSIIGSYYSSRVATGFGRNLRARIFGHVENFSLQ